MEKDFRHLVDDISIINNEATVNILLSLIISQRHELMIF